MAATAVSSGPKVSCADIRADLRQIRASGKCLSDPAWAAARGFITMAINQPEYAAPSQIAAVISAAMVELNGIAECTEIYQQLSDIEDRLGVF